MIVKEFKRDGAYTLSPEWIKKNESGWEISGEIHEDLVRWVNTFKAEHPIYGNVWGDFESKVFADSEEAYNDFFQNHSPEAWDYMDI